MSRRFAFTLVELLVVIAIIGILVALLLPAVQAAREAARRVNCLNHLSQLIIAVHNYEMGHGVYPTGTTGDRGPVLNWPRGEHFSWIVHTLPYMERSNVHSAIDFSQGVYDPANANVRKVSLRLLHCPSDPRSTGPHSNYAGVHHDVEAPIDTTNNGVFFLNSRIGYDDISDGAAHTLFLGEKRIHEQDLGWMSGTRATLRNTGTPINQPVPGPPLPTFPGMGTRLESLPTFSDPKQALEFWIPAHQDDGGGQDQDPGGAESSEPAAAAGGSLAAGEAADPGGPADAPAALPPIPLPPGAPNPVLLIVGGFSSAHPGVCQFAFGDGRVTALSVSIDPQTYRQLGHRADGQLLDEAKY